MRFRSTRGRDWPRAAACERGFTLLESLIALLVLSGAVTVAVQGFALALRAQAQARSHLEAVALAEARMEALALLPRDSLAGYRHVREGGFDAPFERFRWRALTRPLPDAPQLVQAAVLVEWEGGSLALETTLHAPAAAPGPAALSP